MLYHVSTRRPVQALDWTAGFSAPEWLLLLLHTAEHDTSSLKPLCELLSTVTPLPLAPSLLPCSLPRSRPPARPTS